MSSCWAVISWISRISWYHNNILPIGSCIYVLFCCLKNGWGWKQLLVAEANSGKGRKFPNWARGYCTVVVPIAIVVILVMGYITKFAG